MSSAWTNGAKSSCASADIEARACLLGPSCILPTPGPGQVLVKLAAAGLNYIDVYQRSGQYPNKLPYTMGLEGSGTVAAVGPQVTSFKGGDPVAYTGVSGAYAEYALVPAERLVRMPAGLDVKVGAAAMLP